MTAIDRASGDRATIDSGPDLAAAMLPPPERLLADPLAYIAAEHGGQRALCVMMENLAAAGAPDPAEVGRILDYIRRDLARHVHDEEGDLFPLLRRRCLPEDDIELVLARLNAEHADEDRLAGSIVEGLDTVLASGATSLTGELREQLFRYARSLRRHLAMENSIVLPLARARLAPDDVQALSQSMTRRFRALRDAERSSR